MAGLGLMNRRRAIASSPIAGKGVEDLLSHIAFHYNPTIQGATNENLASSPILQDLSGNGFNLNLINFVFDGVKDGILTDAEGDKYIRFSNQTRSYASGSFSNADFPMSRFADYTIIAKREWISTGASDLLLSSGVGSVNYNLFSVEFAKKSTSRGRLVSSVGLGSAFVSSKSTIYQVTDSYNGVVELPYNTDSYNVIKSLSISTTNAGNKGILHLYAMIVFDIKLSPEDIARVIKYYEL